MNPPGILYCHCQYAQVLPAQTKAAVLQRLCASGHPFEAVPDLCEMAARRDPLLARLAAAGPLKIAACFPRAVKGLFASAGAPLTAAQTEVVNLRVLDGATAAHALLEAELAPNLPESRATGTVPAPAPASVQTS